MSGADPTKIAGAQVAGAQVVGTQVAGAQVAGAQAGADPELGLARHLLGFARLLRSCGLHASPAAVITATQALTVTGLRRRDDLYWSLHACFVRAPDEHPLFDQAFHLFWRNPRLLERLTTAFMPPSATETPPEQIVSRRLSEALASSLAPLESHQAHKPKDERDAAQSWSHSEELRHRDFDQMSLDELTLVHRLMAKIALPLRPIIGRRHKACAPEHDRRRIDLRRSLQNQARGQAELLRWTAPELRPPGLVVLCDISGSMARYARMFLLFTAYMSRHTRPLHCFVFGTRLTHVTRTLSNRDPDEALAAIGAQASDWSGGTRIGHCLYDFNRNWGRRLLGQGAAVIIMTDGLDRGDLPLLAQEAARLQRCCRRLLWLNPLLRYDRYSASAGGARILEGACDLLRASHNLASFEDLAQLLNTAPAKRRPRRLPT